jgi:hypothetical protein
MRGHVEVNDTPAVVGKDNEAEQEQKCGRGDDEKIAGGSGVEMIVEKSPPTLGGRPLVSPGHVLRHGGFGHVMTEQPERGLDARRGWEYASESPEPQARKGGWSFRERQDSQEA